MKLLVGLGNPGRKYSNTKHNFGFWVLDQFVETKSMKFQTGKGEYLLAKREKLFCIKPISYMNNSGIPTLEALQFYRAKPEDMLVIYDDIDLPLGNLRFRKGGGSGGHKGIESIIYHLKSENFIRLRIGIATDDETGSLAQFVLTPFDNENELLKNETIDRACNGIEYFLTHELQDTMNQFNEKNKKGLNE